MCKTFFVKKENNRKSFQLDNKMKRIEGNYCSRFYLKIYLCEFEIEIHSIFLKKKNRFNNEDSIRRKNKKKKIYLFS